jgi:hypothetical protein
MKKITLSFCFILAIATMSFASNSNQSCFLGKNLLKNIQLEKTCLFKIKFNSEGTCTVTWSYGGASYSTGAYSTCAEAREVFKEWRRVHIA